MSELKATPGPWFAENSSVVGRGGEIVATCVVGNVYRGDDAEDYATAHLIAASPALYDFLEAKSHHLPIEDQHAAYLLLAKARGEQP